jgi:hypothetical protein
MHQTPNVPIRTPLTCKVEPVILCWERQIEVLGDNDTDSASTCYSNFSLEEGAAWVSEEESDPEEDPNVNDDPDVDRDIHHPTDEMGVVDGPEFDSDTSGTFFSH